MAFVFLALTASTAFAGAPLVPYHPSYEDVRRPGASTVLEVPITSATVPALPKALERAYASLPAIPWRGALRRLGVQPVWLRPSYTPREWMLAFASSLADRGSSCFNVIFHSSELLPGGSPYTPDAAAVDRFLADLRALFERLVALGARGRTCAEFARDHRAA